MVYAAVLAGGSGLRMGGSLPKQFLEVAGRPIIIRSIQLQILMTILMKEILEKKF